MFDKKAPGGAEHPTLKADGSIEVKPLKHEKYKKTDSVPIDDLSTPLNIEPAIKRSFKKRYAFGATMILILIFIAAFFLIYNYGDWERNLYNPKYKEETKEIVTKETISTEVPQPILFSEVLGDHNGLSKTEVSVKGYLLNKLEDYTSKNLIVDDEGNEILIRMNRDLYDNPNIAKYFIKEGQTEDVFLVEGEIRRDFNIFVLYASNIEKTEKDYITVEKEIFTKKNITLMIEQ